MITTNYLSKALCIFLAVVIVLLWLSKCSLTKQLAMVESALEDKTTQYEALKTTVALQNNQIQMLAEQSKAAEERFEKASAIAEANNKKLDKTIAGLQAAKGSTCTDAIPLINEIFRGF